MNRWWIALVAALAVILALVLFRNPDAPKGSTPAPTVAVKAGKTPGEATYVGPGGSPGTPARPGDPAASTDPLAADQPPQGPPGQVNVTHWEDNLTPEQKAALDVPEVWTARKSVADLQIIERALMSAKGDHPEVGALADQADALTGKLRSYKNDPQSGDWKALELEQRDLLTKVRAANVLTDPAKASVDHMDTLLGDYDAGRATRVVRSP